MERNHRKDIRQINFLTMKMESLYHLSSLKLGITDSVSIVLYSLYDAGGECLLSDIYKGAGISKQTVNSAVRSLEADGILRLERHNGRAKRAVLTDKGKDYVQTTAARLYQAEISSFDTWTEEEISTYLRLMEKYADCLRQQIEKL